MNDIFNAATNGKKPLVSVVVPAYNEARILNESLEALYTYLASLKERYDFEMIVVNDGSSDNTGDIADEFARTHTGTRVLHHMYNFRLGQALRYAFKHSRGDYVVVMDVDMSYSPDHIERMMDAIVKTRAKIVIASPYMKGGKVTHVPWIRKLLSRYANRFLSAVVTRDPFSDRLTTFTGMVRAYQGDFIRRLNLKAMDVDVFPEIIYKAMILRARIIEIPAHLNWKVPVKAETDAAAARKSSLRIMRSIIQSVLSGFMFRPFMFFIIPGLVLLMMSVYPLGWTLFKSVAICATNPDTALPFYLRYSQAVSEAFLIAPHGFVIGGFCVMVGIQLISLGLQALQSKRYYEELFHISSTILTKTGPEILKKSGSRSAYRNEYIQ